MTSVKEFRIEETATPDRLGRARFVFTNDYSVFDWGTMPDTIPHKGESLCTMGAATFEALDAEGIATHYKGCEIEGTVMSLADVIDEEPRPPREMVIDLTRVPELPHTGTEYDYEAFHSTARENYLIPLEIVFRNQVPLGSSLRSRVRPSEVGLSGDEWPDEPVALPEPVVEFSTKFEEQDRYLSREKADHIAGAADIETLESIAREVNDCITGLAEEAGLAHEDGKIECLYYEGEIRVADVAGTFDENRFSYAGREVSKEVLRQYYKRTQPQWVEAVKAAKREANEVDDPEWRARCSVEPESLPAEVIEAVSDLYGAGTNAYVDRELFDAPPLDQAVEAIDEL